MWNLVKGQQKELHFSPTPNFYFFHYLKYDIYNQYNLGTMKIIYINRWMHMHSYEKLVKLMIIN